MPENETKVLEFEPREWKDDKEGGTPIDALALNRMEQGIADAIKGVNDVNLNLMTYLVESDGETAALDINGRPMPAPCYIFDKSEGKTWFDSGVDGEQRVSPFPTQADMQAVRDSLGQSLQRSLVEGASRTLTDLQLIDTNNLSHYNNAPAIVGTEDASRLTNSPVGQGAFYAYRIVMPIRSVNGGFHFLVLLFEFWPRCGRIWSSGWNCDTQSWSQAWKAVAGA